LDGKKLDWGDLKFSRKRAREPLFQRTEQDEVKLRKIGRIVAKSYKKRKIQKRKRESESVHEEGSKLAIIRHAYRGLPLEATLASA